MSGRVRGRGPASILRMAGAGLLVLLLVACGGDPSAHPEAPPRGIPLAPDSLAAWIEAGEEFVLLDIQSDSLFEAHHVPGSVHAGARGVQGLRAVLPFEPRVPIVVVNTDGVPPAPDQDLSVEARAFGFPRVFWLEGGVEGWERAGHPVDGSRVFPAR